MLLKLFEFLETFMIGTILIRFEKTGFLSQIVISLENLKIKFDCRKVDLIFFALDNGVCLLFNKGNELNTKRIEHKSLTRSIKLYVL